MELRGLFILVTVISYAAAQSSSFSSSSCSSSSSSSSGSSYSSSSCSSSSSSVSGGRVIVRSFSSGGSSSGSSSATTVSVVGISPKRVSANRLCMGTDSTRICQNLIASGSSVVCEVVETRVDCALKLTRGEADFGVFSEEEILLLSSRLMNFNRVVATIRNDDRTGPFAFQTVAVVRSNHTGGLAGLRGGRYCHPGFGHADLRWSPRVLKTLEYEAANSDRCSNAETAGKTAEELEVEQLNSFFSAACRPGTWSVNATIDARLKSQYPNLCSLCSNNGTCAGYIVEMGNLNPGGTNIDFNNRHIQALQCLRTGGTVAYVAWQHTREFFSSFPDDSASFALLCPDGSVQNLDANTLSNTTAPCAFVSQPWPTVVASTNVATTVLSNLRSWWPNGLNPGTGWQSTLYSTIIGGTGARVFFEDTTPSPFNYTLGIRSVLSIPSNNCIPPRRWCTTSSQELNKCAWIQNAAHFLGIQPAIDCQQRRNTFECLRDLRDDNVDFITAQANYGYLARQHYKLTAVKMVQNNPSANARVAAVVKENSTNLNDTRFESLRDKVACFPEYGGLVYVAFVRAAHERGIINRAECDYMKAVGEFFSGACAPGAEDASHVLLETDFNATRLCSACQPASGNNSTYTCDWNYSNMYYGNNGSLTCLNDPSTDVAFLQIQNVNSYLTSLGLQANQFRVLCANNTLASNTGFNIDDACLLAHVVDSEVLTRRNDQHFNALGVLLENLEQYFGYQAATVLQLVNLEMYSSFDGRSNLLFKDSAVGITDPTDYTTNPYARHYVELFSHLESCNSSPPTTPAPGLATRNFFSIITLAVMTVVCKFVIY